ncbi:MAG TPA: FadR/GntR family transcriptional regulator [Thermoleophilaceae bacterium]|nr:FadR/GntR family transcriptional regulator [Thermoleophilaceae bacterium]
MTISRLREQLAASLAGEIVSGQLPPGSPVPSEPELIEQYGVSKTVARETVQLLASVGLVKVQHGKRTTVLEGDEWDILSPLVQMAFLASGAVEALVRELHQVRQLLEPHAAAQAAVRATPEDHSRLASIAECAEASVEADANRRFLEADRAFHLAIVRSGSHNRVLSAILRDVYTIFHAGIVELSEASRQTAIEQHKAIAEAICASDPVAAEQLMHDHLDWAAKHRGLRSVDPVSHARARTREDSVDPDAPGD